MAEATETWATWIISTIMAALSTMIATVVFLARMIESKYTTEIKELKEELKSLKTESESQINKILIKCEECQKDRQSLAIRVAQHLLAEDVKPIRCGADHLGGHGVAGLYVFGAPGKLCGQDGLGGRQIFAEQENSEENKGL